MDIKNEIRKYSIPITLFFVSRFGLFLLIYFGLILIPVEQASGLWRADQENLFIDGLSRWDSGWYFSIVTDGYSNTLSNIGQDTAFFPLYPIIVAAINILFDNVHLSGILASNIAFFFSLIFLYDIILKKYSIEIAERALLLICLNPFSFYFSAFYTESIFLLMVVLSFFFAEKNNFFLAATWAAFAGATRFVGIIMIIPLLLLYLEKIEYDFRKIKMDVLWLFLSFSGLLLYMIYLWYDYGNPLQFYESQHAWGTLNPFSSVISTVSSISFKSVFDGLYNAMNVIHLVSAIPFFILLINLRKIDLPYAIYSVMLFVVSLPRVIGMGRYLLVSFPVFIMMALVLKNKSMYQAYLYINILFLSLFSIMFSHWYWVA